VRSAKQWTKRRRENVGYESDVAEETMSGMVKLAKEIDEPDKLRIEDVSVDEKNTDDKKGPVGVIDGGEDTDERVKMPHSEMCEKSEVASVEEGHEFERDELDRGLKSALETQVLVCADEWLSVSSDHVDRLGNEQEAKHKEVHQAAAVTVVASN